MIISQMHLYTNNSCTHFSWSALQFWQVKSAPICAPTPTRSPTLISLTAEPTFIARPTTSWPTQIGRGTSPQPPVIVCTSEPQTPQASMAMSMSWSSKGLSLNCGGCQLVRQDEQIVRALRTSCFLKVDQFFGSSTTKPSAVSGYGILIVKKFEVGELVW